jgi:hypothetical protein
MKVTHTARPVETTALETADLAAIGGGFVYTGEVDD